MSENYIVINGKRIELTEDQLKALGIVTKKNPFERVSQSDPYYYIDAFDEIHGFCDNSAREDDESFNCVNYFNDKQFAVQVALHQLLYRKLLKFAYDNECEDTAEWDGVNEHWCIYYGCHSDQFDTTFHTCTHHSVVYFSSDDAASRAIEEVIKPFMKKHPEFVW